MCGLWGLLRILKAEGQVHIPPHFRDWKTERVRDWPKSCRRNRAKMIDSTGLAWAPQPGG